MKIQTPAKRITTVAAALTMGVAVALASSSAALAEPALAETGPGNSSNIDFSAPGYTVADQSPTGQNGWTSPWSAGHWFDWALVDNSSFPQSGLSTPRSLRFSNNIDNLAQWANINQLTSPRLTDVAGEPGTGAKNSIFDASFTVASATGALQPRLVTSVTIDNGTGSRSGNGVTLLHGATGLQLLASWVDPAATGADAGDWRTFTTATYDATVPHVVRIVSEYVPGDTSVGPDTLKVYLDGTLVIDGYSYEGYHEAANSASALQVSSSLLFRAGRTVVPTQGLTIGLPASADPTTPELAALEGNGFLFEKISYATYRPTPTTPPTLTEAPLPATTGTELDIVNQSATVLPFTASGFEPFENVGITLYSTPYFAGWFRANAAGVVTGSVTLPAGFAVGQHTLQAVGQSSGNVAIAAFTVALPDTGPADLTVPLLAAGTLLGAGLLLFTRRRGSVVRSR